MGRANVSQSSGRHHPWLRSRIYFQRCLALYWDYHFDTKPGSTCNAIFLTCDDKRRALISWSISMTGF